MEFHEIPILEGNNMKRAMELVARSLSQFKGLTVKPSRNGNYKIYPGPAAILRNRSLLGDSVRATLAELYQQSSRSK